MWVAVSIAGLAAVFLSLLCVPIDLTVRLDVRNGTTFRMKVAWFHSLLTWQIGPTGRTTEAKREKPSAKRRSIFRRADIGTLYEILKTRGMVRQVVRFLNDVFRQLKFKSLDGDMRVGLGDPADTGLLFTLIGPVMPFLTPSSVRRIAVRPDFGDGAVCEGFIQGALRLQPIRLIVPVRRFVFSLPVIRLGKKFILRRWKSKK